MNIKTRGRLYAALSALLIAGAAAAQTATPTEPASSDSGATEQSTTRSALEHRGASGGDNTRAMGDQQEPSRVEREGAAGEPLPEASPEPQRRRRHWWQRRTPEEKREDEMLREQRRRDSELRRQEETRPETTHGGEQTGEAPRR